MKSPEFKAAYEAWLKDRAKADDWYLQKIRKIKAAAAGRNFELVQAVDQELASRDFVKMLTGTKWKWTRGNSQKVEFMENGEMIHDGFKARWALIPPYTVVMVHPNGSLGSLVYNPDDGKFTCRDFDGSDKLSVTPE